MAILRLDRTIEVSVTNTSEKKRILKRLGAQPDYAATTAGGKSSGFSRCDFAKSAEPKTRRHAWRRLIRRGATGPCDWSKK